MTKRTLFLPVTADQGLEILRRQRRLEHILGVGMGVVICYNSRDAAERSVTEGADGDPAAEVAIVVVEVDSCLMTELFFGDLVHVPPTARNVSPDALELEHYAQDRIWTDGRFSLEIAPAKRRAK